jgi:hypothetical protein
LTKDGQAPKSGNTIIMTYEPNFGTSAKMRISTKDLFRSGVTPDRVFAFAASDRWGTAKLAAAGHLPPLPVRLYSGTCRGGYTMEFVQQLDQVKIEAKPHGDRQYIVEIAVPWKELGTLVMFRAKVAAIDCREGRRRGRVGSALLLPSASTKSSQRS